MPSRSANVPASQLVHAIDFSDSAYLPSVQFWHSAARTVEYAPAWQSEQLTASPSLNLPSSQLLHTVLPLLTPV